MKLSIDILSPSIRKNPEKVKKIFKNTWRGIILTILFFVFFLSRKSSNILIVGGIVFLLMGIERLFFPKEGRNVKNMFLGALLIYDGILALCAKFFLPSNLDLFILISLTIILSISIIYFIFRRKFGKFINFIALVIYFFIAYSSTFTIPQILKGIKETGFQNPALYVSIIIFFILSIFVYFIIIKILLENIVKIKLDNSIMLALAIGGYFLSAGYFYINLISSPENRVRDFLLLLLFIFITSYTISKKLIEIGKRILYLNPLKKQQRTPKNLKKSIISLKGETYGSLRKKGIV